MLEIKKLELERMKVECAKAEMLVRIMENEANIERLNLNIAIQEKRIQEITEQLNKDVDNG